MITHYMYIGVCGLYIQAKGLERVGKIYKIDNNASC